MKHYRLLENVPHLATLATLSAYFFATSAAYAAQSHWVQSEGGDVRIVADRPEPDGTIPAILDIRLKPGWKTYWLEPGSSGIPPQVSIDPQDGIAFSGLRFPAPKAFHDGIASYTGYDHSVAFPLSLKRERRPLPESLGFPRHLQGNLHSGSGRSQPFSAGEPGGKPARPGPDRRRRCSAADGTVRHVQSDRCLV